MHLCHFYLIFLLRFIIFLCFLLNLLQLSCTFTKNLWLILFLSPVNHINWLRWIVTNLLINLVQQWLLPFCSEFSYRIKLLKRTKLKVTVNGFLKNEFSILFYRLNIVFFSFFQILFNFIPMRIIQMLRVDHFYVIRFLFGDNQLLIIWSWLVKFLNLWNRESLSLEEEIVEWVVFLGKFICGVFWLIFLIVQWHLVKVVVNLVGFDVEELHFCLVFVILNLKFYKCKFY